MCKMCKKCVKKIFPCVKVLQNFCTFQIYTEILDHVKRALGKYYLVSSSLVTCTIADRVRNARYISTFNIPDTNSHANEFNC